jgi:anthraniloyl-CoA monooxygenase
MEDAIGLVEALGAEPDPPAAFGRYEAGRRPAVERMQELARRSQLWWESFPGRLHLPAERLMVAYMTRAGNVALDRFAATNAEVVATALAQYAGAGGGSEADVSDGAFDTGRLAGATPGGISGWVLDQPLEYDGQHFPHRVLTDGAEPPALQPITEVVTDPWDEAGDAVVQRARAARANGAAGFRFSGPADRPAVLTRLDLAERVRTEAGGLIVVDGPAELRDDLAAGLVSDRADLICFTGEPGGSTA